MAFTQAHLSSMKNAGRTLLLMVAGFGIAAIAFGLSKTFWFSVLTLAMLGRLDNISVVSRAPGSQIRWFQKIDVIVAIHFFQSLNKNPGPLMVS